MQKQELKELSEKIIAGTATEEEMILYNRLCNEYYSNSQEWDDTLYGDKNELEKNIKKEIWKQAGMNKPVFTMKWFKWAAAASVILTIYIGSLLIKENFPGDTPQANNKTEKPLKNDVAPGQTGAITGRPIRSL